MHLNKLKLLTSKPIDIGICKVYHTTINEVDDISEETYNKYLNILLFNEEDLYENTEENMEMSEFDLTIINAMYNDVFKKDILDALTFFLKEDVRFLNLEEYSCLYLGELDDNRIISKQDYFSIRNIVTQLNCIEKSTKPKAGNKLAEDFMKEMEALKKKYKKVIDKGKDEITMADLVSAITWKGNKSYDEVLDFTVYRLYDALNQINILDNYTFTMNGVYAGTVDTSKMKTKLENLNWIKQPK